MEYSISVIVSFYNAKKYLSACIKSLQKQTLSGLELIFINDGSTDGGEKQVEEYARKNENIFLTNKSNSGLGASRNVGMQKAHGKYIYFLDADDYIANDALERAYAAAEKYQADMVTFDSINIIDNLDVFPDYNSLPESYKLGGWYTRHEVTPDKRYNGRQFTVECLNSERGFFPPVWLALYRKSFLSEHNLEFEPIIHEDNIFSMELNLAADTIVYLNQILHFRRIVKTSITNQVKGEKHIAGGLRALEHAVTVYKREATDEESKRALKLWCLTCAGTVYKEMKEAAGSCRRRYKWKYISLMTKNREMFNMKLITKSMVTL